MACLAELGFGGTAKYAKPETSDFAKSDFAKHEKTVICLKCREA